MAVLGWLWGIYHAIKVIKWNLHRVALFKKRNKRSKIKDYTKVPIDKSQLKIEMDLKSNGPLTILDKTTFGSDILYNTYIKATR